MCINVACRADVAVPQPLLNLLQAHAIGIEQTGAAMAQIVKADTLHLVCDQKIREMLAQEIGPNPFSHRVYIDIVKIIGAIAFAADLPILLLLLFHFTDTERKTHTENGGNHHEKDHQRDRKHHRGPHCRA